MQQSRSIEVVDLGKRYRLGARSEGYVTLRDTIANAASRVRRRSRPRPDFIWALRELDLVINTGEVVGVVGRNGAGKTTLLKVLARIIEPTVGVARMRGRVGALLEVGTGFHPELTGRENIFLNGAVLGIPRGEIRRRFDEIVAFSELERFLDTPLKRYSSGMQLRLAFAVAAHLEPEIVVVDEVLAVGDAEFQRKCLGKMSELTEGGRTALFVSHDLGAVARLCRRAIWLEEGRLKADGASSSVIESYQKAGAAARTSEIHFDPRHDSAVQLLTLGVMDPDGRPLSAPRRGESISIRLRFLVRERTRALDVSIWILNRNGSTVLHESWSDVRAPADSADQVGEYEARLTIPPLLPAGTYTVGAWVGFSVGALDWETLAEEPEALTLEIWPRPDDVQDSITRDRVVQPEIQWTMTSVPPGAQGDRSAMTEESPA